MPRTLLRRRLGDVAALVAPFAVGALGSIPTITAIGSWYRTLERPSWNPPDAVFGPAWSTLYLLMGIALVLVRRAGRSEAGPPGAERVVDEGERVVATERVDGGTGGAQAVFGLQLALNLAWSYAFFGLRSPAAGAVVVIALWLAILATIAAFARHSRLAAALLVPYLAWVTFATALNLEIWRRNPG